MIRDEYKRSVRNSSPKEERKKKEMGERNFYAAQIPKLRDACKAISFSTNLTVGFLTVAYVMVLAVFILSRNLEEQYSAAKFVVWSCVYGAVVVFTLLWYFWIKPSLLKKVDRYKAEIDRINAENFKKASYGARMASLTSVKENENLAEKGR